MFNLAWIFQSRPSEIPTKIRVWCGALEILISLENFNPGGRLWGIWGWGRGGVASPLWPLFCGENAFDSNSIRRKCGRCRRTLSLGVCPPVLQKLVLCVPFSGSRSKQTSKGPWSKMLAQGHNLRLRDEGGGRILNFSIFGPSGKSQTRKPQSLNWGRQVAPNRRIAGHKAGDSVTATAFLSFSDPCICEMLCPERRKKFSASPP